jgi:hypothetical protein
MKSSSVAPITSEDEEKASRIVKAALQRPPVSRSIWQHLAKWLGIQLEGAVATNEVSTAKYTIITFLPVNLFEQFMRVANLYFLLCAVLQLIPKLSPTSWFTTVAPLVFVLAVNAVKEGFDDYHRHRNDSQVNNRLVLRETGGEPQPTMWKDVVAGDVLKVRGHTRDRQRARGLSRHLAHPRQNKQHNQQQQQDGCHCSRCSSDCCSTAAGGYRRIQQPWQHRSVLNPTSRTRCCDAARWRLPAQPQLHGLPSGDTLPLL